MDLRYFVGVLSAHDLGNLPSFSILNLFYKIKSVSYAPIKISLKDNLKDIFKWTINCRLGSISTYFPGTGIMRAEWPTVAPFVMIKRKKTQAVPLTDADSSKEL